MLKQRLLTAIILIPLFIFLLFKLSSQAFYLFTLLIVAWGAWEWAAFIELRRFLYSLEYILVTLFSLFIAALFPLIFVLSITSVWWLMAAFLVMRYPKNAAVWSRGIVLRGIMGLFVLVPCALAINFLRNGSPQGISVLLFLFVLIWGADSGAYFIGKKWGKHKLIPQVSPGKTWEGLFGALLVTLILALLGLVFFKVPYMTWPLALPWLCLTVLFSILGDLFESMLKRQARLKDSGHLLPGHGGILDRIDSLTAAAPVFVLGLIICHWI